MSFTSWFLDAFNYAVNACLCACARARTEALQVSRGCRDCKERLFGVACRETYIIYYHGVPSFSRPCGMFLVRACPRARFSSPIDCRPSTGTHSQGVCKKTDVHHLENLRHFIVCVLVHMSAQTLFGFMELQRQNIHTPTGSMQRDIFVFVEVPWRCNVLVCYRPCLRQLCSTSWEFRGSTDTFLTGNLYRCLLCGDSQALYCICVPVFMSAPTVSPLRGRLRRLNAFGE